MFAGVATVITKRSGVYRAWLDQGGAVVVRHDGRLVYEGLTDLTSISFPDGILPAHVHYPLLQRLRKSAAADREILLYHYRPVAGLRDGTRPIIDESVEIIRNERFHFSNPRKFEDQADCQLEWWLDLERWEQESVLRWGLQDDYARDDLEFQIALHLCAQSIRLRFDEMFRPRIERAVDATRILCLTTKPDDPRMWDEYADHHSGVCFELAFPADDDGPLAAPKVRYRPSRLVRLSADPWAMAQALFLTKTTQYAWEDEYRCIDTSHDDTPNDELRWLNGALRGMILGVKLDRSHREALISTAVQFRPAMTIKAERLRADGVIELYEIIK